VSTSSSFRTKRKLKVSANENYIVDLHTPGTSCMLHSKTKRAIVNQSIAKA